METILKILGGGVLAALIGFTVWLIRELRREIPLWIIEFKDFKLDEMEEEKKEDDLTPRG